MPRNLELYLETKRKQAEKDSQKMLDTELSRVRNGKPAWGNYDSPLASFENDFRRVLPAGGIVPYIENLKQEKIIRVQNSTPDFLGLEVMGTGTTLFNSFPNGLFTATAGLTLHNHNQSAAMEQQKSHTILAGDINSSTIPELIHNWLEGRCIDLIIFRPGMGINSLPKSVFLQFEKFQELYAILAKGGTLLATVPFELLQLRHKWSDVIYPEKGVAVTWGMTTVRIDKNVDAPEELPFVHPTTAIRTMQRRGLGASI